MTAPLKNPLDDDGYATAEDQLEDMREALLDAISLVEDALALIRPEVTDLQSVDEEAWRAEAGLFLAMFPVGEQLEDEA